MWDEPQPARPPLHLFAYNLSSAPKRRGGTGDAPPLLKGPWRQILVCNEKTHQVGVLWQERTSGAIYITWLDADLTDHETIKLKGMADGVLAAGTADTAGNLYYLEIQKGPVDPKPTVPLRRDVRGRARRPCNGPAEVRHDDGQGGLRYSQLRGAGSVGSMVYRSGMLGVILPRIIDSGHQVASTYVFSASDPATFKDLGTASSHSFGNFVAPELRGGFLGVNLGDNYPRGVHLHRFSPTGMVLRVVFTYKTVHLPFPRKEGSAVYEEISSPGKTYYQWSNDNGVYTELGGVVEGQVSYSVIFATDRSPQGRVLDNRHAVEGSADDPRDLAMLRIVKDFDKAPGGTEVSDAILAGIPEGSKSETGGFYDFGGKWTPQRITGVIWLTHFKQGEGADAPQPLHLRDGTILILWEKTGSGGPAITAPGSPRTAAFSASRSARGTGNSIAGTARLRWATASSCWPRTRPAASRDCVSSMMPPQQATPASSRPARCAGRTSDTATTSLPLDAARRCTLNPPQRLEVNDPSDIIGPPSANPLASSTVSWERNLPCSTKRDKLRTSVAEPPE